MEEKPISGKVRHALEYEQKKHARARFKHAVHFLKSNEQTTRANSMAKEPQQNNV